LSSQLFGVARLKKETPKAPPVINSPKIGYARTKLNTQFGLNFISGSAVVSGVQLGRLIYSKFPIYIGPELSFMLFSPGSILNVLLGGWVESHVFSDPKKTLDFGLFLGTGFSNQRVIWKTTTSVILTDITYTQEMDESLSLRAQLRPGVIDRKMVCGLNFNAQFRFP
jgi:hypothetical protein